MKLVKSLSVLALVLGMTPFAQANSCKQQCEAPFIGTNPCYGVRSERESQQCNAAVRAHIEQCISHCEANN